MNELAIFDIFSVDSKLRPPAAQMRDLERLLYLFYQKFNPLKCDSAEGVAAYYFGQLPLLSQKLLATYGSDLCCVLDDNRKSKHHKKITIQVFISFK